MSQSVLLNYATFEHDNRPYARLTDEENKLNKLLLADVDLAWSFDFSTKFCAGWADLLTGEQHPCPSQETIEPKHSSCPSCRTKTGFNPAYYHSQSISEQQQEINKRPHFIYLALFSKDVIKIGVAQEARGIERLLEQGARLAIKLDTFPSALIARQYEAQIAKIPNIAESVLTSKKN